MARISAATTEESDFDAVQIDPFKASSVPGTEFPARPLNEDMPHRLGSSREEMPATFPALFLTAPQSQPGFVDQGGGLEGLALG